jgi:hypothetical protein
MDEIGREVERGRAAEERKRRAQLEARARDRQRQLDDAAAINEMTGQFLTWARKRGVPPLSVKVGWFKTVNGWFLAREGYDDGYASQWTQYLLRADGTWLAAGGGPRRWRGYPGCAYTRPSRPTSRESDLGGIISVVRDSGHPWP